MRNGKVLFAMLVLVETAIYGLGNVLLKVAYVDLSPLWCSAFRFSIGFAVFMAVFGGRVVACLRRVPMRAWLPTALLIAVANILNALAVNLTSATNAGFFVSLPMLFVPAFALVAFRRRYAASTALLQVLVVVGLYCLCCNGGSLAFGPGEVAGLASSACFAASMVAGERALDQMDFASTATVQAAATALTSVVMAVCFESVPALGQVSLVTWGCVFYLGVGATFAAYLIQNLALSHLPSTTVSVLLCAEPVCTAVASYLLLGETLGALGLVGATLVIGGTVAATLAGAEKPAPAATQVPATDPASGAGAASATTASASRRVATETLRPVTQSQ